jgi:Holliday junction resolvase RusA-like endonuclease
LRITVSTENCDITRWYIIEESACSKVNLEIEIDKIVSVQSRNNIKQELRTAIQNELSKFEWLVAGSVNIEFLWFLNGVERQETDKVGDIDNITKPIIDALIGEKGILIDDSQIGSLHAFWQSRNEQTLFNKILLKISIDNDYCLYKENLYFIQYEGPMCMVINIDFKDVCSIFGAVIALKARQINRKHAMMSKKTSINIDRYVLISNWDIHKTRLNGFDNNRVMSIEIFKQRCYESGLTWRILKNMWKMKREQSR